MARHAALYYDGRTARAQTVEVDVDPAGIAIRRPPGVFIASWPAGRVLLGERPVRGEPVRLALEGSTARLVIEDHAILDELGRTLPQARRSLRVSRRDITLIGIWATAAVASIAAIVFVIIPLLSAQFAAATPDSLKQRIGEQALGQIRQLIALLPGETAVPGFCNDGAGLAAMHRLTARVLGTSADNPPLVVYVINAKLVNAFALPGGIVVVTQGLIDNAGSPEEVAGVLAHEIGHVHHLHPTQAIYRTTAVSLLIAAIIGDITGGTVAAGIAEWTLNSAYSRDAEREADEFAVARLNAAGIDARPMAEFFRRAIEEHGDSAGALKYLSTHPSSRERIAAILAAARADGSVIGRNAWIALRGVCRSSTLGGPMPAYRSAVAR